MDLQVCKERGAFMMGCDGGDTGMRLPLFVKTVSC